MRLHTSLVSDSCLTSFSPMLSVLSFSRFLCPFPQSLYDSNEGMGGGENLAYISLKAFLSAHYAINQVSATSSNKLVSEFSLRASIMRLTRQPSSAEGGVGVGGGWRDCNWLLHDNVLLV